MLIGALHFTNMLNNAADVHLGVAALYNEQDDTSVCGVSLTNLQPAVCKAIHL